MLPLKPKTTTINHMSPTKSEMLFADYFWLGGIKNVNNSFNLFLNIPIDIWPLVKINNHIFVTQNWLVNSIKMHLNWNTSSN